VSLRVLAGDGHRDRNGVPEADRSHELERLAEVDRARYR
jgi:hypothetical protein